MISSFTKSAIFLLHLRATCVALREFNHIQFVTNLSNSRKVLLDKLSISHPHLVFASILLVLGTRDRTRTGTPNGDRFSYHFGFRRHFHSDLTVTYVRGLDCVFTIESLGLNLERFFLSTYLFRYFPYSLYTFLTLYLYNP